MGHLVYGGFLLIEKSFSYYPNYFLSLIFWILCYFILCQILYFIKNNSLKKIFRTIDLFFYFNCLVMLFQLFDTMLLYETWNPYGVTNSAGDYIKSIYANSSVNFIIMSFFSIIYLYQKKWQQGILAVIFLLMTTYMSGLVIFVGGIIVSVYLFSKVKVKNKVLIIIGALFLFFTFNYIAPSNVTYASRYIKRVVENGNDTPYKVKSFFQTMEYWTSSVRSFAFGAGGGNFSSRAAFLASGDYVSWFPQSMNYTSDEFKEYHLGIWKHDFNNPWDNRNNTANQPFSFYNQILGEYGLFGILTFVCFYLGYFFKKRKILTYSKPLLVTFAGYLLLDYWFEYFSVVVIFELLFLIEIKQNSRGIA